MTRFKAHIYSPEQADAYWQRQQELKRVHLAIVTDNRVIGEVILKSIDQKEKCCTLAIHLVNDSVKNKGFGTKAEILALKYAFETMKMERVYADAILKNTRSQHVLEKVGFREIRRGHEFAYYLCEKSVWKQPDGDSDH